MQRFVYHSFPRRFAGKSDEVAKGLEVLRLVKRLGLLLTPEITEWTELLSDGTSSHPWNLAQKRCCFTDLAPFELLEHSKYFGSFALEFEPAVLRRLGAVPVF